MKYRVYRKKTVLLRGDYNILEPDCQPRGLDLSPAATVTASETQKNCVDSISNQHVGQGDPLAKGPERKGKDRGSHC